MVLASHEDGYNRRNARLHMIRELSFRSPTTVQDAPPTRVNSIDIPAAGEVTILRHELEFARYYNIGQGRKISHVSEQGFPALTENMSFMFQSAIFLYAAMGKCLTVGTTTGKTGSISGGAGTNQIATGLAMAVDEHAGDYVEITSGVLDGWKFCILANDASGILTLDIDTPAAGIDGETFEIFTAPFTHSIRRGDTLPSWTLYYSLPNSGDDLESIYQAVIGVLVRSLELTVETNGDAEQTVGFNAGKTVQGTEISDLPQDFPDTDLFKWRRISTLELTYGAETPISADRCTRFNLSIENETEIEMVVGDPYASYKRVGSVEYTLRLQYNPGSRLLYDLRDLPPCEYASDLNLTVVLSSPDCGVGFERTITITMTKLMVTQHPMSIADASTGRFAVDAEFQLSANGEIEIEAVDALGLDYYEGSGAPTTIT